MKKHKITTYVGMYTQLAVFINFDELAEIFDCHDWC